MSRWSSVMPGRGRRSGSGTGRRGQASPAGGANGAGNRGVGGPPVEDVDGVLLVRSVEDDSFPLDVVAEVAGAVGREQDVVTVIVGSAGGGGPDADHWARLGTLLDSLRARGTERVRLVMSGAGDDRPDRPSVARRIADAWELEVTAPDGAVLITPGGALFVHGDSGPGRAWWRFAPGAEPRKAGRRAPAPVWEEALDGVPVRTAGGCVVDRVPAGVVIRPAGAPGPAPDALCFSVPVDFERLTVLVGAPQAEDVAADEVAAVLSGLPEAERARTRIAPGGRRDLLRLGQSVADLLGAEVEVLTGLPLLDDHAPPGTPPRPTLVGLDGRPSWRPFVSSVVCGPVDSEGRAPVPRPVEIHPPDWILGGDERGTVRLTDRWQATVTRAGLALWTPGGPRPGPLGPPVDPEVCVIELGMPGQPLDDSLLPALSRLVRGLGTDVRSRTTLLVRGRLLAGDGALRRLAAEHGIPGIRYVTAGRPSPPGRVPPPGRAAQGPGPAVGPGRAVPTVAHGPGTAAAPPAAEAGRAVPPGAGVGGPSAAGPGGASPAGEATCGPGTAAESGAGAGRGAGGTVLGPSAAGPGGASPAGEVTRGPGTAAGSGAGAGVGGPSAAGPGGASPAGEATRGPDTAAAGPRAAGPGGAPAPGGTVQGSGADPALPAAGPDAGTARRRTGAAVSGPPAAGPGGGAARPGGVTAADPQATGPVAPTPPPTESPDPLQGGGTAETDGPSAAGPGEALPDVRPDADAPGRPPARAGGPVPPGSPREGGTVPSPDSPPAGGAAGPGGAVPGSPPEAAGPEGADAGASVPAASSEPGPRGRSAEGASAAPPEAGDGVGSERGTSGPGAAPDGGTGPDAAGPRTDSPAGPRPGTAGGGSGPGPDGGRAGRAGTGTGPRGRSGAAPAPERAALPFVPGHVSGAAERAAFRDAAAGAWEGHAAAVSRVLTRMPALRGHELEAARTDLVAAHAYLTAGEGPLHHRELVRDLHTGEGRLLPYAGCLASALRRLPSYRGVALRGGDADGPEPAVGALLHDPAPVSALTGASALPAGSPVRYAIWSVTGRKVRQLLDRPGGPAETHEEIVFVPGTGFRVLGVRTAPAGPPVVLLRELPGNATAYMDGSQELSGLDLKALTHLEESLAKGFRVGDGPQWPERCSGPVGQDG
ncbi:hypothetical protein [Streptomyces sp. MA15]|uniref:hypothetical protein n=1 Tax=Streptomyces sp. MA15 TaxID=3055061 RepID=UPI0025B202D0|nr:hypothetical protein [Streptomyces sp. MA15]MDN3271155.1 hypothetical protein [Streptomyces sp. MA15]